MAFEITGRLIDITPVMQVSDKFRKREFVIERKESSGGAVFVDYIKFQLLQDKCDIIDESYLREEIRVLFNIKGNRWEKEGRVNYFTNLDAWKIEKLSEGEEEYAGPPHSLEDVPPENEEFDALPF
ncbi:MAG: DUF3127 domain-containing protein [Bacteroidales bacterium]|jgi:hypothetical protein|nr:DUF3127 domain-containing protein [Bacteroidales bacterium]